MSFLDQVKADIEWITGNPDGMTRTLTLHAPNGATATITGLHTKHHMAVDTEGNAVNSKNAHCSFSEKFLIDAGYPVRNSEGEVSMINHRVTAKDSTGNDVTYVIRMAYPDETIGLIVCILGDIE